MIGTRISHYEIIELLSEGGMGVVYRARDLTLDRPVALKFPLPSALDSERAKERFLREARAAAALSHPGIATVYEVAESELGMFIAMEFVPGRTVKELLREGTLPLHRALEIARQVAEALAAAHERGVVHRDIKSANIIVSADGRSKITDFGLALRTAGGQRSTTGAIQGTAAYMSPEQLRGDPVDRRTDLWSFGVVLYEMIAGTLPFGEYEPVLLHFILHEPVPPLPAGHGPASGELERIILKCLEKSPEDRYQTAADLVVDLRRLLRAGEGSLRPPPVQQPSRLRPSTRRFLTVSAALLLLALTLVVAFLLDPLRALRPTLPREGLGMNIVQLTGGAGIDDFAAWSPDGAWIVYASDESGNLDLWKRRSEGGEPIQLTHTPGNESHPSWSPDGRVIACSSDSLGGSVLLVPANGGTAAVVARFGARPVWSPDGRRLALDYNGAVLVMDRSGGSPHTVVARTSGRPFTVWSPDGRHLILWDRRKGDIVSVPADGGDATALNLIPSGEEVSGIACSPEGRMLVYSRGQFGGRKNLWKVLIDPARCLPINSPSPITVATTDDVHCAISPDGRRLAYTVREVNRQLWALPLDPRTGRTDRRREQLTSGGRKNYYPALSRDGEALLYTSQESDQAFLYYMDLPAQTVTKLTREWVLATRETGGAFAGDGTRILFSRTTGGPYQIWSMSGPGGVEIPLTETEGRIRDVHPSVRHDAGRVAFYSNRSGNWDVWSMELNGPSDPLPLTDDPGNDLYPAWSPDGRLLSFTTDRNGSGDIWIMRADGSDERPAVEFPAEEAWSVWSPDGESILFSSDRGGSFNIWRLVIRTGEVLPVTSFDGLSFGLPEEALYTKFALAGNSLVVPLEGRRGNIYVLVNPI